MIFGARQHQLEILLRADVTRDRLREARPAGAAVEFVIAVEERQEARRADEGAGMFFVVERTAERALRRFLEQDREPRGLAATLSIDARSC